MSPLARPKGKAFDIQTTDCVDATCGNISMIPIKQDELIQQVNSLPKVPESIDFCMQIEMAKKTKNEASHICRNILYLCFAICGGVVKCAAVYETTNRIHEIHTLLHCLFYIRVFVCRTCERKFAGQTGWTWPSETCVSLCTNTSRDELRTPLPRGWEKYTLVVLTFIVDVVAFERVQCKNKLKKATKADAKEGREFRDW